MPFFPRPENEIIQGFLEQLNINTNITQLSPGAKARFFLAATGREQSSQQKVFDINLLQPYIKYADGRFLDFFGDMLNLPRVEASHAESTGENQMFYVDSGSFGDINGGATFTIPAGRTVFTATLEADIITPGIEVQPTIVYVTTADTICTPAASFAYASVRARVEGSEASLPRNVLQEHDFTGYSQSNDNTLKCTNRYAIDNGTDRESNQSYRYRLQNIFRARSLAVLAAIRLAALSVPGVADVVEVNVEQGPGTYGLYLKGVAPTVSPDLVERVSNATALVTGYGSRPFVSAPQTLGLELVVALQWSPRVTTEQIAQGYNAMRNATEERLNTTDLGESIEYAELIDIILDSSPFVLRIGRNVPNKFEEVYVYKQDPAGLGTIRTLAFGDKVEPLYNERVLLETGNRFRGIQFITF